MVTHVDIASNKELLSLVTNESSAIKASEMLPGTQTKQSKFYAENFPLIEPTEIQIVVNIYGEPDTVAYVSITSVLQAWLSQNSL